VQLACLEMAVSGCFYLIKTGQFCSLLSKFKCLLSTIQKGESGFSEQTAFIEAAHFRRYHAPTVARGSRPSFLRERLSVSGFDQIGGPTSIAASMRVAAAKLDSGVVDMKIDCPLRHPELAGICADDLPRATHVSAPISRSFSFSSSFGPAPGNAS